MRLPACLAPRGRAAHFPWALPLRGWAVRPGPLRTAHPEIPQDHPEVPQDHPEAPQDHPEVTSRPPRGPSGPPEVAPRPPRAPQDHPEVTPRPPEATQTPVQRAWAHTAATLNPEALPAAQHGVGVGAAWGSEVRPRAAGEGPGGDLWSSRQRLGLLGRGQKLGALRQCSLRTNPKDLQP